MITVVIKVFHGYEIITFYWQLGGFRFAQTRMNPRGQVAPQTQLRRVPATPPLLFVSGTGGAAGAT